jgi:pyrroline-5-carboxylate reductase
MKETVGFIGAGNLTQALLQGWLGKQLLTTEEVFVSNRTPGKLARIAEQFKVQSCATNEDLVNQSNVVIVAVKPQDFEAAVEPISSTFDQDQVVISLAAGVQLRQLKRMLPQCKHLVRVMANTPARIGRGAFAYCTQSPDMRVDRWMERMFKPLGFTIKLDEGDQFEAFSVACSAGVGFVYEMMIYWQEWLEERGIDAQTAQNLTVHTFLGASELALSSQPQSLDELQARVASKKGITAAGLASMRELEIERLLRYSFEKSAMRDRELSSN